MTAFDFQVVVKGIRETRGMLGGVAQRAADPRPVFNLSLDQAVRRFYRKRFETEGRFAGRPWQKLAESTLRYKQRRHRANMGILRLSNRLFASLTKRRSRGTLLVIRRDSYERGTTVQYAVAHQDPRKGARPRRPIVPDALPPRVLREWRGLIGRWITEGRA